MVDLRVNATVTPNRETADGNWMYGRATRDGALFVADWTMALALEGRAFMLAFGAENAPVNSCTTIADTLAQITVDAQTGTTIIPFYGQAVVAVWSTGTLINYMVSVDNKTRWGSGGTLYAALPLRTDAPIASTSVAYVGPDITSLAKSSYEREVYRESMEVNLGDAADYWPKMEYKPLAEAGVPPIVVGEGSVVVYFGATTADVQGYGNIQWLEIPSNMVSG